MKVERYRRLGFTLAKTYAAMSKDPSSRIGAVIMDVNGSVRSGGFNGVCRGVADDMERMAVRPEKYLWMEHAERNAIFNAARIGTPLDKCVMFVTGLPPCARCARAIIQVGIVCVYYQSGLLIPERWQDNMLVAVVMLEEAGVERIGL